MTRRKDAILTPEEARALEIKWGGIRPAARNSPYSYSVIHSALEAYERTPKKVLYFTDTHDTPYQDKSHLYHIAKHIKDSKPDVIVHGGDLWDCLSLCHHVPNQSYKARRKPTLKQDLDSLHEAAQILTEESGRSDFHYTLGNHENWMYQFEDKNPEIFGFAQEAFDAIFKSLKWTVHPYTRYVDLYGVNFVHAPISIMGKPRGAENLAAISANKAVKDVVFGHTHRWADYKMAKDGNDVWIRAINGGCSMPDGYRPDYATGPLGWFYGLVEFTIEYGKIQDDVKQISLKTLRERYAGN